MVKPSALQPLLLVDAAFEARDGKLKERHLRQTPPLHTLQTLAGRLSQLRGVWKIQSLERS